MDTKQQASPARNPQSGHPVHVDGPKHIAVTCISAGVRNASVVTLYNETTNYADASCRPAVLHQPCVFASQVTNQDTIQTRSFIESVSPNIPILHHDALHHVHHMRRNAPCSDRTGANCSDSASVYKAGKGRDLYMLHSIRSNVLGGCLRVEEPNNPPVTAGACHILARRTVVRSYWPAPRRHPKIAKARIDM